MFTRKDEVDKTLLKKVLREFFDGSPVVYDHECESQRIENGGVVLGPWAGPQADMENLFHEMSHLVEIDTRRMTHYGWGFKWGKYWQIGMHSGYEFQTAQSVEREVRTWAIQANLIEYFTGKVDVPNLTSSAEYLSALCYYCKGNKETRLAKVAMDVEALRSKYPIEWFKAEWSRRMKLLAARKKRSKK